MTPRLGNAVTNVLHHMAASAVRLLSTSLIRVGISLTNSHFHLNYILKSPGHRCSTIRTLVVLSGTDVKQVVKVPLDDPQESDPI
jgi:hypothetical protein